METDAPLSRAIPELEKLTPPAGCRSLPVSPPAALTSDARPEIASIALHQAIQVGEPGYLQVGANIVPNIVHCSGNKGPLVTGWVPGMEPRSLPGHLSQGWVGKTTVRAPPGWTWPVQELLPKTGRPREKQGPGLFHLTHQPLCARLPPTHVPLSEPTGSGRAPSLPPQPV